MKILIVTNEMQFIEKFKAEWLEELHRLNHDVTLLCNVGNFSKFDSTNINLINFNLVSRSLNPFGALNSLYRYYKLINNICPDVIVTFTIKPNVFIGFICKLLNINQIQVISGLGSAYHHSKALRSVVMWLYRKSNHKRIFRIYENEQIKKIFEQYKIHSKDNVIVAGSGVNLTKFKFHPLIRNDITKFAFVGRLIADKGIYDLLEACNILNAEGYNFELLIAGDTTNFKRYKDIGSPSIKFLGYLENVSSLLNSIDCLIHPSYHEGMANAILEASAVGRIVIASNINGCMEAIDSNRNGFLFEPGKPREIANAMKKVIKMTHNEKIEFSEYARKKVEKQFDRESVNKIFTNCIERIFNEDGYS